MTKWDNYFMNIAIETAKLSKDPSHKVGAVLVKDKHVKSIGYNGAPHGFPDELVPLDNKSEELINQKRSYMCHAELNSVLNYDGQLSDLKGSTIYVTLSPCYNCALLLAQLGIKEVIYLEKYHKEEINKVTENIFTKCHIKMTQFKGGE